MGKQWGHSTFSMKNVERQKSPPTSRSYDWLSKRRSRHLAWKGGLFARRERAGEIFGEAGAILVSRVVAEPEVRIAAGVGAVPVQEVLRRVELFLGRGENVAIDQAVERPIGKMIG